MKFLRKIKGSKTKLYVKRDENGNVIGVADKSYYRDEYWVDGVQVPSYPYHLGWQERHRLDWRKFNRTDEGWEEVGNFEFEAVLRVADGYNSHCAVESIKVKDDEGLEYNITCKNFVKAVALARKGENGWWPIADFGFKGRFKFNTTTTYLTVVPIE